MHNIKDLRKNIDNFKKKLLIITGIVNGNNKYEKMFGFFKSQNIGFLKFILF